LAIIAVTYGIVSLFLRLILWWIFGRDAGITITHLPAILGLGIINDLLELVYLFAPLTLLLLILPPRWLKKDFMIRLTGIAFYLLLFGFLYLQAVEFFFFDEFDSRFNLIAVDYLMYPNEVFINLWESYPVVWFLFGFLILTTAVYKLLWPPIRESIQNYSSNKRPWARITAHTMLVVILALFLSTDSLSYSSNRVKNEISANGISSFFNALLTDELDYDLYYSTLPREEAFSIMRQHLSSSGGKLTSEDTLDIHRQFESKQNGLGKLNVIILSEESLGAGFIGTYGDTRGLSPNFDRLAKEGLLFKNAYATGTRTVRGLEAMSTSFPPIPSESIVKRPGNENIANWGMVLKQHGYHSSFIYGGFGMFDNMNHFFGSNGFELSDRTDIKNQTFANIWGVCDEDLFKHAISYYDQVEATGKPFFSIVMTTSNHKPYTFPSGIPGIPPSGGGRDAGVKYADYAIGKFFEEAPKHSWYKNSIIIVMADHDARVYGRALVPIERYRIPLLLIAPGKIAPREEQVRISQIDLMPTVLGLLGLDYTGPFYGSDVLVPGTPSDRAVLVSHNHDVAIFNGKELSVLGLQKKRTTYSYDPTNNAQVEISPNEQSLNLATAYLQTAFELFKDKKYK